MLIIMRNAIYAIDHQFDRNEQYEWRTIDWSSRHWIALHCGMLIQANTYIHSCSLVIIICVQNMILSLWGFVLGHNVQLMLPIRHNSKCEMGDSFVVHKVILDLHKILQHFLHLPFWSYSLQTLEPLSRLIEGVFTFNHFH